MLAVATVSIAFSLAGCFDDNYDAGSLDMTVGIGGGELALPVSSIDTITLDEVLEIKEGDCIKINANGDYVFKQDGGDVAAVHPEIDKITVVKGQPLTYDIELDFKGLIPNEWKQYFQAPAINIPSTIHVPDTTLSRTIYTIDYQGDKPEEIVSIDTVDVEENIRIHVPLKALNTVFPTVKALSLAFPEYMTIKVLSCNQPADVFTLNGTTLQFTNVPTTSDIDIELCITELTGFDNEAGANKLAIVGDKVLRNCNVDMSMTIGGEVDLAKLASTEKVQILANINMEDFIITGARGQFDPTIDLHDLGDTKITGVPDFLTDEQVVVDLYNPMLFLTIESDLDIEGVVAGNIHAIKDGAQIASVNIPEMHIYANKTTEICVCRVATDELKARYGAENVYVIENLSDLVKTIPDRIEFTGEAHTNKAYHGEFLLGHKYTLKPKFSFEAPIAFGKDAVIVYTETVDNINKDIQDYELGANAYLEINADVMNSIPAFIDLKVTPTDLNGNDISDQLDIAVTSNVQAYDGKGEVHASPLKVILKDKTGKSLKKLEGLDFRVEVSARGADGNFVEGITLNKEHCLSIKNLQVKLVGTVIADLN